jgi:hypothetical protein
MLKRYGKLSLTGPSTGNKTSSLIEYKLVEDILEKIKDLNLTCFYNSKDKVVKQFFLNGIFNNEKYNHSVDFFIKEIGYILEIDGDFWHCNVDNYEADKIHPVYKTTFLEGYLKHIKKIEILKTNKFVRKIRNLWETELSENYEKCLSIVIEDIKSLLKEVENEAKDKC